MTRSEIMELINAEIDLANSKFPAFHSAHEGYAILKKELDELWDEIKTSKESNANKLQVNEAIQVAAMAIKFIENLYNNKRFSIKYFKFPDEK